MKKGACVLLMMAVLLLTACNSANPPVFAYREGDFTAEVEVLWGEVRLACEVLWEGGSPREIVYSAPAALEGVRLTRGASGWMLIHGTHRTIFEDVNDIEGLLSAVNLLGAGQGSEAFLSRQPTENGWLVEVEDAALGGKVAFTMDADGFPRVVTGGGKTLRVLTHSVWREGTKK